MNTAGEAIDPVTIVCQRYNHGWLAWLTTRPDKRWSGRTSAEALGKAVMSSFGRINRAGLGLIETRNHDGRQMRIIHPEAAPGNREEASEWDKIANA